MKPTLINCITACAPDGAKMPATLDTDREAVETALSCIGLTPPENARVIRIKNTLMLGEIEVSEAFAADLAKRPDLTSLSDPVTLPFDVAGRLVLSLKEITRMARLRIAGVLALALSPSPRCPRHRPSGAQQKVNLIFSAGPTGGTWTPMAAATAEVIKKKYPELDVLVEPGAALVNMEKMRSDKADIAWSMTTVMADARAGANSWKGKQTDKAALRRELLSERLAARGAAVRGHPQARRSQGQGGGPAAARQHQPRRGVGAAAEGQRHEARRPRHEELRLHHRERRGHPEPAGGGDGLVHDGARLAT